MKYLGVYISIQGNIYVYDVPIKQTEITKALKAVFKRCYSLLDKVNRIQGISDGLLECVGIYELSAQDIKKYKTVLLNDYQDGIYKDYENLKIIYCKYILKYNVFKNGGKL